jgi:hypothetical protein
MHVHCNAKNAKKKVHRIDRPAEQDDKKKFETNSVRLYAENQRSAAWGRFEKKTLTDCTS